MYVSILVFWDRIIRSACHPLARRLSLKKLNMRTYVLPLCIVLGILLPTLAMPTSLLTSAQSKVGLIEADRWPPNKVISFNSQELLALGLAQMDTSIRRAIADPTLQLLENGGT